MMKQNLKIILILSFFTVNSLFSSAPRPDSRSDVSVAGDSLGYSADSSSPALTPDDLSDSEVLMAKLAISSKIAEKIGDELYHGGKEIPFAIPVVMAGQVGIELKAISDKDVLDKLRLMETARRKEIADYLAAMGGNDSSDIEGELTPFNTPLAGSKSK